MSLMLIVFTVIALGFGLAVEMLNVEQLLAKLTGLQSNYGAVGLVMILNFYIISYLGVNVGRARKKY